MEPIALDALLAVLSKHNVKEYTHDQFGTRLVFGEHVAQPVMVSAPLLGAPDHWRSDTASPLPASTEPTRLSMDDVLYGAK